MNSLTAYASEQQPLGFFRIYATPPGGHQREITLFRDAPVKVGQVTTQDPFTDQTAQLTCPQITVFDTPGSGDLDWLVPNCDIDIIWTNVGGYEFTWRWEGYIAAYNFALTGQDSSFTLDCKGAFYGLDDYLAMPGFPKRPIPYEILLAKAFDQGTHPAHLGRFRILFPRWWHQRVPEFDDPVYLRALKPWGVRTGQLWTGFTSRSTGSWEPVLTGFVQTMLTVMYAAGGAQWSIRNRGQRRPELYLRTIPASDSDGIIEITLGAPGVSFDGSRDYTQRAGVIYGAGKDQAGVEFSNMQITPDGKTTYFKPFAYSPRMYPRRNNPFLDPADKPKEVLLRFTDGVDEVSAMKIAQGQYQRFSEPGITGTITLTTDPRTAGGALMPRMLIKGGATIRINGLLGIAEGVLAHVTESTVSFEDLTTTLTFDTKYRDQLTVEEVRARNRDALTPLRWLQVGKYANTIQDLVLPWSTKAGSGIIPTPAKAFFAKIPDTATFPYEQWTRKYPPSNPAYAPWYVRIDKTDTANSNNNWSAMKRDKGNTSVATMSIPIRMGQSGSIRLTQLAAYDRHGNVMPVKFHFSIYTNNGLAVNAMPEFPVPRGDKNFPKYLAARSVDGSVIPTTYTVHEPGTTGKPQCHPFYEGAWEEIQPDGTHYNAKWGGSIQLPDQTPVVGWGNYHEPAGYSPGLASKKGIKEGRTGLLEDTTAWSWDLSEFLSLDDKSWNEKQEYSGMLFIMIYCDDQDDRPVFFMGRLVRQETGAT